MLRRSSHLLQHVKKLELELQSYIPKPPAPMASFETPKEEDIPLVQTLFAGLTTIHLKAKSDFCPWYLSTSGLVKTIGQALAVTRTLDTLDVTGLPDFPIRLLMGCRYLRRLRVSRLGDEDDDAEVVETVNYLLETGASADRDIRCTPTFLHLDAESSIHTLQLLKNPRGPVNLGEIRELSTHWGRYRDFEQRGIRGSDWIQLASLRLCVMDWQLFTRYNLDRSICKVHHRPVPALATFKGLKTMIFCAAFRLWGDSLINPLCWIVEVLEGTIQSRNTLNKLLLKLQFQDFTELESVVLSDIDWSPLDTLHKSFSKLEEVILHLRVSTLEQEQRLLKNKGLQKLQLHNFDFRFDYR
ncbi:hypothetical protein CPB83DRAFT_836849 [Crepidotus variabilis]|uniref:Uncharacterized protein n=1 Tax=Crepidotus variabilis TaxID=179855 RepID=A0A9P6EDG8_9AGAR|nr:hypothetical protein CPB83DRAFT_836849 [Crepidotus variabilis]